MEIPDIAVSVALVTGATVVLSFVLNQGYAVARKWVEKLSGGSVILPELGEGGKKSVVAGVSLGLSGYSGLALIPAGSPPELLLVYGTAVFKASQLAYDKIWKGLLKAK